MVSDTAMTGYAWSATAGWITLSATTSSQGVLNDGNGNLSGYAWGQGTGWINFDPTYGGVTIDSSGYFHGYAWSQKKGWIVFNCDTDSTCGTLDHKVKTSWTASSGSDVCLNIDGTQTSPPSGMIITGNGNCAPPGGGGGNSDIDVCPNIDGVQTQVPAGYQIDIFGGCVPLLPPPTDVCPNLDGDQSQVPQGYQMNGNGDCVPLPPPPIDVCPNIEGDQETVPSGMEIGDSGNYITSQIGIIGSTTPGTIWGLPSITGIIDRIRAAISINFSAIPADVLSALGTIGLIFTILSSPFSRFRFSLPAFFFPHRKKKRPWGTVYDSVTKQPLDPAYVVLKDVNSGKEVATSITDLDGRYGFLVSRGSFQIVANKTNYIFPSQKLSGKKSDELYSDLYFGDNIVVQKEDDVIVKNVPLDPIKFDWNEFAKKGKGLMRFYSRWDRLQNRLGESLFIVGFLMSGTAFVAEQGVYNSLIIALYGIMFLLRILGLRPRPCGVVVEKSTGNPLSFGILRVFSANFPLEIAHAVCDRYGKYYCLVPPGPYKITIERKMPDGSYSSVFATGVVNLKKGIIREKFNV